MKRRRWADSLTLCLALFCGGQTAWQWEGGGNKTNPSGKCLPCSGKQGDMNCGYLFPCFASDSATWGHKDICISSWAVRLMRFYAGVFEQN